MNGRYELQREREADELSLLWNQNLAEIRSRAVDKYRALVVLSKNKMSINYFRITK